VRHPFLRLPLRGTAVIAAVAAGLLLTGSVGYAAAPTPVSSTIVSANPVDNTPMMGNGDVKAFAEIGNTVYVGGAFTTARNASATGFTSRRFLLAYDRTTGAINTAFAPVLDGAVHALAVSPDGKLIVGGAFANVNGAARRNLVELDPATGTTVASWAGRGDGGLVRRTIVSGNNLYIAGAFHFINGAGHSLLARLNATTGAVDPTFKIDASVARLSTELVWGLAVAPDGRTLVAVGNFTRVNGLVRNQVVMVDLTGTPVVANWSTDRYVAPCSSSAFPFYARDVDFSDDGGYFVIGADGGQQGDAFCDSVSRWESSTRGASLDATWVNRTGFDSVTSVEAADNVVYVAGHFRWLNNANGADNPGAGAVDRYGYGALDPINGMPMAWNPTRGGAPAGTTVWGPIVWELWRGSTGLFAGFDNDGMGGEYHGRMGMYPLAGARVAAAVNAPVGSTGFLYLGAGDGKLTKVSYQNGVLGTPAVTTQANLAAVGATYSIGNKLYWSKTVSATTSTLQVATFANGVASVPWLGSGFNAWFKAAAMTGAFYVDGRLYYTKAGDSRLFYRYFEPDGSVVGCTEFVLPSQNVAWGNVRGMALIAGRVVYGSTDGSLRSVAFSDTAVDGSGAVILAAPAAGATWSTSTLFFATS
jgi:hypothetical protein